MSKNGLPRKPLTKRRLKNLILNVLKNPINAVVLVSLIIPFCLIIIPLLSMISSTFTRAQGELRRVQGHVGDFTLYYCCLLYTSRKFVLRNKAYFISSKTGARSSTQPLIFSFKAAPST